MNAHEWDAAADLVVVGFGAAGAAAAISGADQGASVILLEKQPASWHTPSTRASGGQITAVSDPLRALGYFDRCAGGMVPLEVSKAWVERAADVNTWLEKVVGVKMTRVTGAEHPEWEGAEVVSAYGTAESYPWGERSIEVMMTMTADERAKLPPIPGGGASLMAALEAAVRNRDGIRVLYEHPAARLVQTPDRRIVGVEADTPSGRQRFHARRAVVLTCGGYEYDEAMKISYLRAYPMYFYGSPMNTGDGVRMAQAVGADLWHMNSMIGRAIAHVELEGKGYNFFVNVNPGGYLFTDKYGQRFVNEHMQAVARHDFYYELINYDAARAEYPRMPCYWFFDQRRFLAAPIPGGSGAAGPYRYEWSPDNQLEIDRGWIVKGEDFESLASKAGIFDPAQAARTITEYNEACRTKADSLGRPPESLIALDTPPFYCMKLWPGGPNTSGGPRRNKHAQVVDVFGDPIPGLYEAGELGEAVGALYPSNGANLSDALCFGRIAVEHALEAPVPGKEEVEKVRF
jgi:succinate dehydrogenase/fumarate reductase flavoprotein subunit